MGSSGYFPAELSARENLCNRTKNLKPGGPPVYCWSSNKSGPAPSQNLESKRLIRKILRNKHLAAGLEICATPFGCGDDRLPASSACSGLLT